MNIVDLERCLKSDFNAELDIGRKKFLYVLGNLVLVVFSYGRRTCRMIIGSSRLMNDLRTLESGK